ncbi:ATP F0F1 synthase subunit B [Rhodoligotrophos defluvii]|uniref:F0F1 ATP synthase subunit B family protein n=1 Tax=Rhodoligotrophos defluvii TaxID=2561934 RepID=UPI0010C958C6|nr:ATP F0F1 synthase subunit B [Rhodoligotrophos defluvii]
MLTTPEFWVLISFILFLALLAYVGVHRRVIETLDKRAANIREELAQAQRLREEAQAMLAEAQRKQREAEKEAADIVALAREDAKVLAEEMRRKLDELLERRRALAETKIKQAEDQALKDVRAVAADLAISAATQVIADTVKGPKAAQLVDDSIASLPGKLH